MYIIIFVIKVYNKEAVGFQGSSILQLTKKNSINQVLGPVSFQWNLIRSEASLDH